MLIGTKEASQILEISPDELLFLAQTEKRINVSINKEDMVWQFALDDVLTLKKELALEETTEGAAEDE